MKYDVIVVGGGIAGIAAAFAARRAGAEKVLLLEREYVLGGLATSGLIAIYLPLCDGTGRQVSFSLAEELLRLSIRHGAEGPLPEAWLNNGSLEERKAKRFRAQYNPWLFALNAERQLTEEGVRILYGVSVSDAVSKEGRVEKMEITHRTGKEWLEASAFVDATGDATLCAMAGAATAQFQQGNLMASWYYDTLAAKYGLHIMGTYDIPEEYKSEEQKQNEKKAHRYAGLDPHELSDLTLASHKMLLDSFLADGGIAEDRHLASIPIIPQIRMSRKLLGRVLLDDKAPYTYMPTSIGVIGDWRKPAAAFEIPYEALCAVEMDNLFAAGRCISTTDSMWDITRVIPACAVTGQAAGVAAAMAGETVEALQAELVRQGVMLHLNEG